MHESAANGSSQNNGGDMDESFANGDSLDEFGNRASRNNDQAWNLRGLGLSRFPHMYAHTPNGG